MRKFAIFTLVAMIGPPLIWSMLKKRLKAHA